MREFSLLARKNLIKNTHLNPDLNISKNQISSLKYTFKSSLKKIKLKIEKS